MQVFDAKLETSGMRSLNSVGPAAGIHCQVIFVPQANMIALIKRSLKT